MAKKFAVQEPPLPAIREEILMGNPVPSQEKLELLKMWLMPLVEKHSLEMVNLALIGRVKAGQSLHDVKATLAPSVDKCASDIAYKLMHAVKEIRF